MGTDFFLLNVSSCSSRESKSGISVDLVLRNRFLATFGIRDQLISIRGSGSSLVVSVWAWDDHFLRRDQRYNFWYSVHLIILFWRGGGIFRTNTLYCYFPDVINEQHFVRNKISTYTTSNVPQCSQKLIRVLKRVARFCAPKYSKLISIFLTESSVQNGGLTAKQTYHEISLILFRF